MVTTEVILSRTGLKNSKTLTRWHQRGLIPKPVVRTSPSGRGKTSYWPDWVLSYCIQLVRLKNEGHTLEASATLLRQRSIQKYVLAEQIGGPLLATLEKPESMSSSQELEFKISLKSIFLGLVLDTVRKQLPLIDGAVGSNDLLAALSQQIADGKVLERAITTLTTSGCPFLVFNLAEIHVMPDFMVAHYLGEAGLDGECRFVVPLLPILKTMYSQLQLELPRLGTLHPVPKIWDWSGRDEDTVMERSLHILENWRYTLGKCKEVKDAAED